MKIIAKRRKKDETEGSEAEVTELMKDESDRSDDWEAEELGINRD